MTSDIDRTKKPIGANALFSVSKLLLLRKNKLLFSDVYNHARGKRQKQQRSNKSTESIDV